MSEKDNSNDESISITDKKINRFESPLKKEKNKIEYKSPDTSKKKIKLDQPSGKKKRYSHFKSLRTLKSLKSIKRENSFVKDSLIFDVLKINYTKNYDRIANEFKKIKQTYKSKYIENNHVSVFTSDQMQTKNEDNSSLDNIKKKSSDINEIIKRLKIPQEKRTVEDTLIIRKYLKTTNFERLFNEELNRKGDLCNKLLIFLSLEMKYKSSLKNENLFKIGDEPDFFYLIIEGHVDILKPMSKIHYISGFEYFSYLMNYKKDNEIYLFNLCIKENKNNFNIKNKDIEIIQYIYLLYQLENIKNLYFVDFPKVLDFLNLNAENLGLDPSKINSNEYVYKKEKLIKSKIPLITEDDLKYYRFLEDKTEKKDVLIFNYQSFLTLGPGAYFGESSLGGKQMRNGTAHLVENCSFGFVNRDLYDITFSSERKAVVNKKVYFLYSNFFFNKISFKKFEKNYFAWFISNKYNNGNIIFKEGQQMSFVYFIESGLIELSSTKTILDIQILLNELKERRKIMNDESNEENLIYTDIKSGINDLENHITKVQKNNILFLGKDEMMGLESFYYNIPYLTTAKVISPKAVVHKIDTEHLAQILLREKECMYFLRISANNKIDILTTRFFELNNMKLKLLDEKITRDEKIEYEKYLKENKQLSNSIVKKNDKNKNNSFIKNNSQLLSLMKEKYNIDQKINNQKDETKNNSMREIKINKKNRSFTILPDLEKTNKCRSFSKRKASLLNSEKLNLFVNKKKLNIIENRMIRKLKLQLKLLKKNKYFFSNIKTDEKEKINNKIETSKIDASTQKDFFENNNQNKNSQPKKNKSIFFTQLEDIKTKMNTIDSTEISGKINNLISFESIVNKPNNLNNKLNIPSFPAFKSYKNKKKIFFKFIYKIEQKDKNSFSADSSLDHSKLNTINEKMELAHNSSMPNLFEYVKKNKYYNESSLFNKMEKYKIFEEYDSYFKNKKEEEEKAKRINNLKGLNQYGFPLNINKALIPKNKLKFNKNSFDIKIKKYKEYKKGLAKKMEEING